MNNMIDKLAWVYIQDGKLLTVRSKGKHLFYLPGGKREQGETDEQALIREIQEELSVELTPQSLNYAGTFNAQADGKAKGVTVQLTCYYSDFTGALQPAMEIEEFRYVDITDKAICSLATMVTLEWLVTKGLIPKERP